MLRTVRLRLPSGMPREGLKSFWELTEGSGQVAYSTKGALNNMQLGSLPTVDVNDPSWIPSTGGLYFNIDDYCIQYVLGTNLGTVRISLFATNSFLEDMSRDFTPFCTPVGNSRDYIVVVADGTGLLAMGYIGELGKTESLGSNTVVNGDFANWTADNPDNWEVNNELPPSDIVTENAGTCRILTASRDVYIRQVCMTINKLYQYSIDVTNVTFGGIKFEMPGFVIGTYSTLGTKTGYFPSISTSLEVERSTTVSNVSFDNIILQEVLTPNSNGVYIYSGPTGNTRSWAQIQTGFKATTIAWYKIYRADLNFRG